MVFCTLHVASAAVAAQVCGALFFVLFLFLAVIKAINHQKMEKYRKHLCIYPMYVAAATHQSIALSVMGIHVNNPILCTIIISLILL